MADEVAVAEQPSSPTLAEAYGDQSLGGEGGATERSASAEQDESSLREQDEQADREAVRKPKKTPTLGEAFAGVDPGDEDEAEPTIDKSGIPEALQRFDPAALVAAMEQLGLEDADLQDPRWVDVLQSALESEAADPEAEGETEQDDKAPPAEEVKPGQPVPQSVAELSPEKLTELNQHIEKTWNRSRETNDPVMTEVFVRGLAGVLQTPAADLPVLKEAVDVLSYGAQALVESAVPKMLPNLMHEYMRENLLPALEYFLPGLGAMHNEALISNTWADVLAMEEFRGADLPAWEDKEAFNVAAEKVHRENPWLANWDPGPNVPIREALQQKAILTAKLLMGATYSPEKRQQQIAQALATGKKSAERSTRRVSAGRMLGRGKTEGIMGAKAERSTLMDAYNSQHHRGTDGI